MSKEEKLPRNPIMTLLRRRVAEIDELFLKIERLEALLGDGAQSEETRTERQKKILKEIDRLEDLAKRTYKILESTELAIIEIALGKIAGQECIEEDNIGKKQTNPFYKGRKADTTLGIKLPKDLKEHGTVKIYLQERKEKLEENEEIKAGAKEIFELLLSKGKYPKDLEQGVRYILTDCR